MKNYRRRILQLLAVLAILTVITSVSLVFLLFESSPITQNTVPVNTNDAVRVRTTAKNIINNLFSNKNHPVIISASEEDFNSLFTLAHQSISRISGSVDVSPEQFALFTSIRIPNIIGDYLNIRFNLAPSDTGIHILGMSLGKIPIPGRVAHFLISLTLDIMFGFNHGKELLGHIDSIELTDTSMCVHMQPIQDLKKHIQNLKYRIEYVRDEVSVMGNPETVRIYYSEIIELAEKYPTEVSPSKNPISFSYFIEHIFKLAHERGGNPVEENQAAILALSIYFGDWRIEHIIGNVLTDKMKSQHKKSYNVVIADRIDLRLHFIISAALEIVYKNNITFGIGEFKELMDARHGGSGFSFVDLAADRAGVRFAEIATDPLTASKTQLLLSQDLHEDHFFPNIMNLPEMLSKESFEHYFDNVNSDKYLALVRDIDTCIETLPVYRGEKVFHNTNACSIETVIPN